ncbi:hypothetical protein ACIPLC_37940 [Kitasatospora sp. NPDC086801]|uniref:hypothetical protein n=1 Tax=Kitasatospora sp. NPDC086801 TaxID=3364066 RepID=UPI00380FA613
MSDPVPPEPDDPEPPDVCPRGEPISPDPPGPDGIRTWKCACGYFGYVLPPDFVATHPHETAVQVCGRKPQRRRTTVPAVAA